MKENMKYSGRAACGSAAVREQEIWKRYLEAAGIGWSYRLAKRMEEIRSNPVLGFRTAGSQAERETGKLLARTMEEIGLKDIHRDKMRIDSWEFRRAVLRWTDGAGTEHCFQLGAYQTQFVTQGFEQFPLVYVKRGGARDYEGLDVRGCLVMIDINQRDEWWINFPVYQAHLKGAAAVIAVQDNGYGEINSEALNAQDIAGPREAPAFSMSRKDADFLLAQFEGRERLAVEFDACSEVRENAESYNIWGTIPGETDEMILLSAHYDSYFSGFQDDNCAVAMVLGIARTLLEIGYRPRRTLVFCAMAAEEWGVIDSKYDWSTGAWQQVFKLRPEWAGKVIVDLNFELPAHAQNQWDGVRSTYEYADFIEQFVRECPLDIRAVYPEGLFVQTPIETWSDDFSIAISGIPSTVNEFSSAEFMETHYHSQFDSDAYYDPAVYRFHHLFYGLLLIRFDRTLVAPVNTGRTLRALRESLEPFPEHGDRGLLAHLEERLDEGEALAAKLYGRVQALNNETEPTLTGQKPDGEKAESPDTTADGTDRGVQENFTETAAPAMAGDQTAKEEQKAAVALTEERRKQLQRQLLHLFRKCQDHFVRLDWQDSVLFPHEAARSNLFYTGMAAEHLQKGELRKAQETLYMVDNNQYAFQFDEEVYRHFTDYVLSQPDRDRLQWGAGRIVHHLDISRQIRSLMRKVQAGNTDVDEELQVLRRMHEQALFDFDDDMRYLIHAMDTVIADLKQGLALTENLA